MDAALIRLVWQRAKNCCEYCRMGQEFDRTPFEIDHIIARKHRGPTAAGNLAESCYYCNVYKGPNLTGRDPATGKVTRLYHPRRREVDLHRALLSLAALDRGRSAAVYQ